MTGSCAPGTLLLRSPSYVHVTISNNVISDSVCDQCLSTPNIWDNVQPVKMSKCSRCKQVYYCNSTCQKQAWTLHKMECKYLTRILPKQPPGLAKLIMRLLIKNKMCPDYSETLPDGKVRTVNSLVMHKKEISSSSMKSEAFTSYLQVRKLVCYVK